MVDLTTDDLPVAKPIVQDAAIFFHESVELDIRMLAPRFFSKYVGSVQVGRFKFLAEAELAGDDLVEGEDDKFDIVMIFPIFELLVVLCVALPSQFGRTVKAKYLDPVGLGIYEKIPGAYIAMDDAQL